MSKESPMASLQATQYNENSPSHFVTKKSTLQDVTQGAASEVKEPFLLELKKQEITSEAPFTKDEELDLYACDSCKRVLNLSTRIPLIMKNCGHSICKECIQKRLNQPTAPKKCPECSVDFNETSISEFLVNKHLFRIIENKNGMTSTDMNFNE